MNSKQHPRHPAPGQTPPEHRSNGDDAAPQTAEHGAQPSAPADAAQKELTERELLKLLLKQFQELREYVSYYAAARTDSVKSAVRNAFGRIALAALGFVAVGGLVVMACWFVLSGLAQGAGTLFDKQAWIGTLITGALALAGVGLGVCFVAAARRHTSFKRTIRDYEARDAQQRARFGHDVHD
jgi:hypothetical protein